MAKEPSIYNAEVLTVPVSELHVDEAWNLRQNYVGIDELATAIKRDGQSTPVEVVQIDSVKGKKYALLAGFRRYKAIETAGLEKIRVQVRQLEGKTDDERSLEARMVNIRENLERSDLSPYEKALICKDLENRGMDRKTIAAKLRACVVGNGEGVRGKPTFSKSYTDNLLRCLDQLHPSLLEKWKNGLLSANEANKLAALYNAKLADPFAEQLEQAEGFGGDANGRTRGAPDKEKATGVRKPSRKKVESAIEILENTNGVQAAAALQALLWVTGQEPGIFDSKGNDLLAVADEAA